jgi:hypothetical protein
MRPAAAPLRWHFIRWLRLAHFFFMPLLAAAVGAAALALCTTPHVYWVAAVATAFVVPTLAALFASTTLGAEGGRWWHLSFAAGRLAGLTWFSLLALPRAVDTKFARGE